MDEANQPEISVAIQQLLNQLCIDLGICLPQEAQQRLCNDPPKNPEALAQQIFLAEGLDPLISKSLYKRVLAVIQSRIDFSTGR